MKHKTLEEKRGKVRSFIRDHPGCTYLEIRGNTKIKVERVYKNMREAYKDAGVELSKNLTKRNMDEQRRDIINYIKKNPGCTVTEIQDATRVTIPRVFGSILDAYKQANVIYPNRKIDGGVMNLDIINRSKRFEKRIIGLLTELGNVTPKVRTSTGGIIDCLFECDNETFVVEIKDFRARNNITMSQIKQIVRYMRELNCKKGLIICSKESFPKRKNSRKLYVEDMMIRIVSEEDIKMKGV
ncbi:MAG: winged helix-turn-helix transcriptional regulator [Nanoarchaeota archaeon]